MKKILKWIGIVLGSLIGLLLVAVAALYLMGKARMEKVYDFPPSGIVVPTDEASIARGKHIVETTCIGCHDADLGGKTPFIAVDGIMALDSVNLTSGEGGIGGEFSDEDFVRAIRHGINREGKPIFMPAVKAFAHMSDEDLAAVIAYLRTAPPVDRATKELQVEPMGFVIFSLGVFGNMPVEDATHENNVTAPAPGVTVEYGEYRLTLSDCHGCHYPDLAGGKYGDPTFDIIVPNLTPGGDLANWTAEGFIQTMRTGVTPEGRGLNSNVMPLDEINNLTDDELTAIWLYLQSLPALPQRTGTE